MIFLKLSNSEALSGLEGSTIGGCKWVPSPDVHVQLSQSMPFSSFCNPFETAGCTSVDAHLFIPSIHKQTQLPSEQASDSFLLLQTWVLLKVRGASLGDMLSSSNHIYFFAFVCF
jgi:hypothetical protein